MVNRFGTTSDMVIQPIEENGVSHLLAIDGQGLYLTSRDRLDKQLADPNRYSAARKDVAARLRSQIPDVYRLIHLFDERNPKTAYLKAEQKL